MYHIHIPYWGIVFNYNYKELAMKSVTKSTKTTYQHWLLYLAAAVFIISPFIGAAVLYADMDIEDRHGKPLEVVLKEIREKYNISPDEAINPRKVNDEDLEELGEADRSVMFSDPRQHEIMDNMMGGEGSRRLARMHERMGYNYLASKGNSFGQGMMGGMM
jgi:hypothetical protein